jgi:hypothetical protein
MIVKMVQQVRDQIEEITHDGGIQMVQLLERFNKECTPIAQKAQTGRPREIVYRVRGEVRFLGHYIGLADYRIGHRIRVLVFKGLPCDEVVQVRFGRLNALVATGA